jgi:serine protease Do
MFWSAVSVTIAVASGPFQASPLTPTERSTWLRLQSAFVSIAGGGSAALVDERGLFIAHRPGLPGDQLEGRLHDGRTIQLRLSGHDRVTQLALLKIVGSLPQGMRVLRAPDAVEPGNKALFVIMSNGPFRASFVASGNPGVLPPNGRVLPMSEIRLEAPEQEVGGALLVSYDGELLGVLSATVSRDQGFFNNANALAAPASPIRIPDILGNQGRQIAKSAFGPSEMTVAYAAGTEVIRHVLSGFRTTGEVDYPAIGVFCLDAVGGGALVQRITPGSPAEKAGLRPDDIILDVNGTPIRNQVGFGMAMFRQRIGNSIPLRIRRGGLQMILSATVGK